MVSSYTLALFGHILGVLFFTSGIAIAGIAFEIARRRATPSDIAATLSVARAGVPLVGVGAMMVLGFGLWLVHLGHWGYGTGWVSTAIALFIAAMLLGAIGGREPRRARIRAHELAAGNHRLDPQLRALLDDPISRATNYASTVILLVILGLMVFKP